MPHPAQVERSALCDLLLDLGPDRPTLNEGWTTYDLAVHLMVRDRRPDALGGMLLPGPFAAWTEHVQRQARARTSYADAVAAVRAGPPLVSLVRLPAANLGEYFVHHEDVRRANGHDDPRELDTDLDAALWAMLRKAARVMFRRAPAGVELVTPDGRRMTAHGDAPTVTVTGPVGELVLLAFNRVGVADVQMIGEPDAVAGLRATRFGF